MGKSGLLGWRVRSFKLPARIDQIYTQEGKITQSNGLYAFAKSNGGKEVQPDLGNEAHTTLLRELRPLTATFERVPDEMNAFDAAQRNELEFAYAQLREEEELRQALELSKTDK